MDQPTRPPELKSFTRAEPVGRCIYCGATEGLSDEHVIPYALGGALILPDSSCPRCAGITSDFERRVLRGFMQGARVAGNYPTRRPKERPKSLPLEIEREGRFESVEVPTQRHPALLFLPLPEPPGIIAGRPHAPGVSVRGIETLYFGKNPADAARELGVKTIRTTENWDVTSFARLLAKVAYSWCVAAAGTLSRDDVVILLLILGAADDASHWIGSADFRLEIESRSPTHALAWAWMPDPGDVTKELLVVRVKLFVPSGATGYEIVVSRRSRHAKCQEPSARTP